jgi:hypothetical protein
LVCKYKKLWGNAPEPLKKKFITLGNTSNGSWRKFREALRDPTTVGPLICDNTAVVSTVPQSEDSSTPVPSSPSVSLPPQISIPHPTAFPPISPLLISPVSVPGTRSTPAVSQPCYNSPSTKEPSHEACDDNLCPYCDRPLPLNPSPGLVGMRTQLEFKTWPDPLPHNPNHRWTDNFTTYIDFCQRHIFESDHLLFA